MFVIFLKAPVPDSNNVFFLFRAEPQNLEKKTLKPEQPSTPNLDFGDEPQRCTTFRHHQRLMIIWRTQHDPNQEKAKGRDDLVQLLQQSHHTQFRNKRDGSAKGSTPTFSGESPSIKVNRFPGANCKKRSCEKGDSCNDVFPRIAKYADARKLRERPCINSPDETELRLLRNSGT